MTRNVLSKNAPNEIKLEIITKVSNILRVCFQNNDSFYDFRYMLFINGILLVPHANERGERFLEYLALEGVSTDYDGTDYSNVLHGETDLHVYSYIPADRNLIPNNEYTNERNLDYQSIKRIFGIKEGADNNIDLWYNDIEVLRKSGMDYRDLILSYPIQLLPKQPVINGIVIGTITPSQDVKRVIRKYRHRKKVVDQFIASTHMRL